MLSGLSLSDGLVRLFLYLDRDERTARKEGSLELNAQDLSIQNAAVSRLQQQELHEEQDVDNLTYWKEQLASTSSVLALPTDRLRSSIQTYQNDRQNFALSRCLSKALKAISQQEGVTLFMTLLAAFQTLLYRWSGQDGKIPQSPRDSGTLHVPASRSVLQLPDDPSCANRDRS